MSNNEKALKESAVRIFLQVNFKRNDIGNLEIVFTQGSDEPHILFLIPVHIKDVMDDFVKHSTPLRIEVGEDWKGFAPKKQFDGIQDYVDANQAHNEDYLNHIKTKCIPPVAPTVKCTCTPWDTVCGIAYHKDYCATKNNVAIELQHKLPENPFNIHSFSIDGLSKRELLLYSAVQELQDIVLKLMEAQQEKNK
jgi:hypothetical protein